MATRLLAQRHTVAAHAAQCLHAVLRHLRQHGQLDLVEGLWLRTAALLELLQNGQCKLLLVVVALKLIEHLLCAPGDLAGFTAAQRRKMKQQSKQT